MASGNRENNIAVSLREAEPLRHNENTGRFQQALDLTKNVRISEMHRNDVNLLNKMTHERTKLLQTSSLFHYLKFADLFDVPKLEARLIENAEGVLEYLTTTREDEPSVADVLQKLKDTERCCDLVRKLVNSIIQREQNGV